MNAERGIVSKLIGTLLALAAIVVHSPALAGDKALAETLFIQGRKLMEAERYAEACPKLEASNREDASAGTMLNLAICYEKLGRSASAWALYKETIVRAKTEGRSQHADAAESSRARLEPTLSKLTIVATHPRAEGLVVRRSGVTLGSEALGVPIAVDPGEHTIEATAPGYEGFKTTVTLAAAEQKTVQIPTLAKAPEEATPVRDTSAPPSSDQRAGGSKTLGYVLVGAGAAVTGVGLVFGYLASQQASDAEDDPTLCPSKRCTPAGLEEIDAAETKALVSTIGVGVGLLAVGAGVYFLVSPPHGSERAGHASKSARVVPLVGPTGGGLSVEGSF
jgi:hypothetical protein